MSGDDGPAVGRSASCASTPFAYAAVLGYNMADYWAHWLEIGRRQGARLPASTLVNWFRKNAEGKFMWPRLRRQQPRHRVDLRALLGEDDAVATPIGLMPRQARSTFGA